MSKNKNHIPDFPGADKGLLGVKTPVGRDQEDAIRDRLQAGGVERTLKATHAATTAASDLTNDDSIGKNPIPAYPGAEEGLMGVKAPSSWRQTDGIRDRLVAGGVYRRLPGLK